jgi:Na+/H+ antiporter NhaD/arsenite permease-like protein
MKTSVKALLRIAMLTFLCMSPSLSWAADFDGRQLSAWWALPFAGILLSIAILPLLLPRVWHHHYGKISAAWALAFFVPFGFSYGTSLAGTSLAHALLAEYIPFIVLLTACSLWLAAFIFAAICTAVQG